MNTVTLKIERKVCANPFGGGSINYGVAINGKACRRLDDRRIALIEKYANPQWNHKLEQVIEKEVDIPIVLLNSLFSYRKSEPLIDVIHLEKPETSSDFFLDEHWSNATLDIVKTSQGLTVSLSEHHVYGTRLGQGGVEMACTLTAKDSNGRTFRASEIYRHRTNPSKDRLFERYGDRIITSYLWKDKVIVRTNKKTHIFLERE